MRIRPILFGAMLPALLLSMPTGAAAQGAARPPAFAGCAICHKTGQADKATIGPNLWKIGGRKAGAGSFNYSPKMKESKLVWNKATLTAFIMTPQKVIPGTKMAYAGQKDPKIAAAITDYLLSLK